MIEFKLPELGENVTAGDVMRVLVKAGDAVANDQPVLELETDKATIEVPSTVAGVVKEIKVKPGEKVKVGATIFTIDGDAAAGAKPEKGDAGQKPQAQPEGAPEDGGISQEVAEGKDDDDEAQSSASAGASQGRADREGSKNGVAKQPAAQRDEPGDDRDREEAVPRKRGEVVDISRAARPSPQAAAGAEAGAPSAGPAPEAAPSGRGIARELGVDIRQITGSGVGGRITVDDVQGFVRQAMAGGGSSGAAQAPSAPGAQPLPDFSKWGDVERKPLSNIRRKTAEHLGHAWSVIPHVTQHDKADITALEELRKKYGPQADRAGGKLTVTVVALKIVAAAIRKFPQFAASIDLARGQLVYKKYAHVGVAADTDRGLLVPVIRDVDKKGIVELSAELAKASEKARAGKLSLEEMSGGVMTITNLGGIGGVGFTPIVNWPEVAILGISRGSMEPVWDGSQFQPRLMLPLSLSYDHRVIDGADAARFLRWVAEAFEQPFVLAL